MSYNSLFGLGTHAADASLEAWWKWDEVGSETTLADSTGNGYDGTIGWLPSDYDETGPSKAGFTSGLNTNPTTTTGVAISYASFVDIDASTGFTMLARAKNNGTGDSNDTKIIGQTSGTSRYGLNISDGSLADPLLDPFVINNAATTAASIGLGTGWNDVAFVVRGGGVNTYSTYVNGVEDEAGTHTGSTNVRGVSPLASSTSIDGPRCDMSVFTRDLSAAEVVEWGAGPEPLNISAPSVTGSYRVGETLSSTTGTWDSQANGTITYNYQWQMADDASGTNTVDISGATAATWQLRSAQSGKYVRCLVSASNDGGNDSAEDTGSAWTLVEAGVSPSYNELFGLGNWGSADPDLEGWWKLDDNAASTTVVDYSGNGRDGVLSSGTTSGLSATGPAWTSGAFEFNGTSKVDIGSATAIDNATDYAFSMWLNNSNYSSNNIAGVWGLFGQNKFVIAAGVRPGSKVEVFYDGYSTSRNLQELSQTSGTWACYTFVRDSASGQGRLYKNGVLQNSALTATNYSAPLVIGGHNSPGVYTANGTKIGESSFLSRVPTSNEISEIATGPEPINLTAPTVSGTHETGQTLTTTDGTWDSQSNGTLAYTYQWQTATDASGTGLSNISGATSSSYTLTASEVGLYVRCLVASSNDGGNDSAEDTGSAWTLVSSGGGGGSENSRYYFQQIAAAVTG